MNRIYLIDGYNLLHACAPLKSTSESFGMERARAELVEALSGFAKRRGTQVVVVFDGVVHPPISATGVRVLSSRNRSADDVIREQARILGKGIVVVSSDLEITDTARANLSAIVSSSQFASDLSFTSAPPSSTTSSRVNARPHRLDELREPSEKPPADDDIDEWKRLFGV
jgi:predicted RNA-binding protein with PIN domain